MRAGIWLVQRLGPGTPAGRRGARKGGWRAMCQSSERRVCRPGLHDAAEAAAAEGVCWWMCLYAWAWQRTLRGDTPHPPSTAPQLSRRALRALRRASRPLGRAPRGARRGARARAREGSARQALPRPPSCVRPAGPWRAPACACAASSLPPARTSSPCPWLCPWLWLCAGASAAPAPAASAPAAARPQPLPPPPAAARAPTFFVVDDGGEGACGRRTAPSRRPRTPPGRKHRRADPRARPDGDGEARAAAAWGAAAMRRRRSREGRSPPGGAAPPAPSACRSESRGARACQQPNLPNSQRCRQMLTCSLSP